MFNLAGALWNKRALWKIANCISMVGLPFYIRKIRPVFEKVSCVRSNTPEALSSQGTFKSVLGVVLVLE